MKLANSSQVKLNVYCWVPVSAAAQVTHTRRARTGTVTFTGNYPRNYSTRIHTILNSIFSACKCTAVKWSEVKYSEVKWSDMKESEVQWSEVKCWMRSVTLEYAQAGWVYTIVYTIDLICSCVWNGRSCVWNRRSRIQSLGDISITRKRKELKKE